MSLLDDLHRVRHSESLAELAVVEMARADISQDDIDEVLAVLQSGRLALGQSAERFEYAVAEYCSARHSIAVNSGTAGLHLLCIAAGLEPEDEVITSSFSFVASTNCLLYQQVRPIFVDIEPDTYCLDPSLIEAAITPRTRAVLGIDVFGHPADWKRIQDIAQRHGLKVIADTCESLGAEYDGKKTGPIGIGGVFAFFPNKQMTTGEGGMIVTDSDRVANMCRSLRNQGRTQSSAWLNHDLLGFNYRLDEMSAALGVSQMRKLDTFIEKRRTVARLYDAFFLEDERVRTPITRPNVKTSPFVYVIELNGAVNRDDVMRALLEVGIPSRGYFSPIHEQKYIRERFGIRAQLPVTERIARKTLALPFHNEMTASQVEIVGTALNRILDKLRLP